VIARRAHRELRSRGCKLLLLLSFNILRWGQHTLHPPML